MPGDPLTAKAVALGPTFSWINHSWDHPDLDGLSYADVLTEFTRNDTFLRGLGLDALRDGERGDAEHLGARQRRRHAGDSRRRNSADRQRHLRRREDNPSPNVGLWNALQPSVLEIPRIPTNLDYRRLSAVRMDPGVRGDEDPGAAVDYPTMIDRTPATISCSTC